ALQPLGQPGVRELDPRSRVAALERLDAAQHRAAQGPHLLAGGHGKLDQDAFSRLQPRRWLPKEEDRASVHHVQVVLELGQVLEPGLEQACRPLFHTASVRLPAGRDKFASDRPYIRYPTRT